MFTDTTSGLHGFCHAPTISLTAPLMARPAEQSQTDWAVSGTECSVHWALLVGSRLLSTSVPLHLQTTIGHQEAPWWPQYYPEGIVGNLAHRNKWGFLQKHGHWDEHLDHKAQVKSGELNSSLFVLHTMFQLASHPPHGEPLSLQALIKGKNKLYIRSVMILTPTCTLNAAIVQKQ